jgi:uncharacterized protein YciI
MAVDARCQLFWVVFNPYRPDLHTSMTPEEQAAIVGHLEALAVCQEQGKLQFAGRAADASHGLAVFEVADRAELDAILADNPAVKAGVLVPDILPYRGPQ